MSDISEVRAKLVEEATKALHRKGIDTPPCSCSGRRKHFNFGVDRIEMASDPNSPERQLTPYLSVVCTDCGRAQFYVLPFLIGIETFNKIAGEHLGTIA